MQVGAEKFEYLVIVIVTFYEERVKQCQWDSVDADNLWCTVNRQMTTEVADCCLHVTI